MDNSLDEKETSVKMSRLERLRRKHFFLLFNNVIDVITRVDLGTPFEIQLLPLGKDAAAVAFILFM